MQAQLAARGFAVKGACQGCKNMFSPLESGSIWGTVTYCDQCPQPATPIAEISVAAFDLSRLFYPTAGSPGLKVDTASIRSAGLGAVIRFGPLTLTEEFTCIRLAYPNSFLRLVSTSTAPINR